jgi:hypothetical protein
MRSDGRAESGPGHSMIPDSRECAIYVVISQRAGWVTAMFLDSIGWFVALTKKRQGEPAHWGSART